MDDSFGGADEIETDESNNMDVRVVPMPADDDGDDEDDDENDVDDGEDEEEEEDDEGDGMSMELTRFLMRLRITIRWCVGTTFGPSVCAIFSKIVEICGLK